MLQQRLDRDFPGCGSGMPRLVGWPGDGDAKQGQPPLLANEPACRRISELEVRPAALASYAQSPSDQYTSRLMTPPTVPPVCIPAQIKKLP